jgi:hypothetical protein
MECIKTVANTHAVFDVKMLGKLLLERFYFLSQQVITATENARHRLVDFLFEFLVRGAQIQKRNLPTPF